MNQLIIFNDLTRKMTSDSDSESVSCNQENF